MKTSGDYNSCKYHLYDGMKWKACLMRLLRTSRWTALRLFHFGSNYWPAVRRTEKSHLKVGEARYQRLCYELTAVL